MKRFFYMLFVSTLFLSGCGGNRIRSKNIVCIEKNNTQTVDSVYQEQSRKEAALLHLRRQHILTNTESKELHKVRCMEARYVDIAVPLHAYPVEQCCVQNDDGSVCLVYDIALSLDTILSFFSSEMERMGWRESKICNNLEYTLLYVKTGKICIISVRKPSHKSQRTYRVVITQFYVQL